MLGVRRKTDDHDLKEKEKKNAKSKEVKTGCNLADSFKGGCGSKTVILPVIIMIKILNKQGN
jgi:hypothetical protein